MLKSNETLLQGNILNGALDFICDCFSIQSSSRSHASSTRMISILSGRWLSRVWLKCRTIKEAMRTRSEQENQVKICCRRPTTAQAQSQLLSRLRMGLFHRRVLTTDPSMKMPIGNELCKSFFSLVSRLLCSWFASHKLLFSFSRLLIVSVLFR